jgi:hypothetical protein
MRVRTIWLASVALGLLPASALAAGQPPLSRLSDAYDGNIASIGVSFQSDGSRYVSFTDGAGQLVALDTTTGKRSTVTLSTCEGQPPAPGASLVGVGGPDVFYPAGLSEGTLVTFCFAGTFDPAPEQYRLIDLATGSSRLVTFDPPPNDGPFNDLVGPGTVGLDWADVAGGEPGELDRGFFNLTTGAVVEPAPAVAADAYEELDSPQLTHRICAPVTTASTIGYPAPPSGETIVASVVGVARPWAVLEVDYDNDGGGSSGVSTADAELYAWKCGARKPVRLGPVQPGREQFGDGIVTWVDEHGAVEADDLATARQWTWPALRSAGGTKVGYAEALHTASAIYAVPQVTPATSSGPQEIYAAGLAGLRLARRKT